MKTTLHLAKDLHLPINAVTEKFAILGQSGGGKTYTAMKLAELMLDAGAQIIALDPVGVWRGLLSSENGKSAGFPVTVFGGENGHLPLTQESAELVADVLVDRAIPAVLDVSELTTAEVKRFVRDFAERFFQRKKKARTPVHLFFEEAQTFAPQVPERDEGVMLNRVERLVKIGRNYGVGCSLISQQPQAIHKRILNQAGTLIAHRTVGKHERKAISDWVVDKVQADGASLMERLPQLDTGHAVVWSPSFLKVFTETKIAKRLTFDSSKTPEFGELVPEPKVLAPVEVEQLRSAMAEVVRKVEENNPAALHRRIRELEREIRKGPETLPAVVKEVPIITESDHQTLKALFDGAREDFDKAASKMDSLAAVLRDFGAQAPRPSIRQVHPRVTMTPGEIARRQITPRTPRAAGDGPVTIKKGAREMLAALAVRHPQPLTRAQIGTLAGLSSTSGTFSDYLSALRRHGYIAEDGQMVSITAPGLDYLGPNAPKPPQTTDELVALWSGRFKKGARAMLDVLVADYPGRLTREELGQAVGMSHTSGTFSDYLSALRRAGLLDESNGAVRANPDLFLGRTA
jgi:hypothetical protein